MLIGKDIITVIRGVVSIITSIMLIIVGNSESNLPSPTGAEVVSKQTYVLLDEKVSSQGVTNDGEYFYFSSKRHLGKADMETGEMVNYNFYAIPEILQEKGCNHIGGLSYYNGIIYAAIEDGPDYNNSFIALYNAETLCFTGKYYEVPHELHLAGVPWCAVDAANNRIYTAEWDDTTVINVFNLETFELEGFIELKNPEEVVRIQGAELCTTDGKLYLSSDVETDEKPILAVDLETGEVTKAFSRNIGVGFEAEDITVAYTEDGPVFYVLDIGVERDSTNLTGYKMK